MGTLAEDLCLLAAELEAAMAYAPLDDSASSCSWPSTTSMLERDESAVMGVLHAPGGASGQQQPEEMRAHSAPAVVCPIDHCRSDCRKAEVEELRLLASGQGNDPLAVRAFQEAAVTQPNMSCEAQPVRLDGFKSVGWQLSSAVVVE
eukprot:242602-Amphidinium_carterae.1